MTAHISYPKIGLKVCPKSGPKISPNFRFLVLFGPVLGPNNPVKLPSSSGTPFVVTSIFYALIWIKMRDSKRLLQSLEVAAFNKQIREVRFESALNTYP